MLKLDLNLKFLLRYTTFLCIVLTLFSCSGDDEQIQAKYTMADFNHQVIGGRKVYYLKKHKDKKEVKTVIAKMENIFKELDNWLPNHLDSWAKSINYWIESDEELLKEMKLYKAAGFYNPGGDARVVKEKYQGVSINCYIQITSIKTGFIMHETTHAFHYQKVKDGVKNQGIINAYNKAKSKNIYGANEYLMTDSLEFFAETSTLYLEQLYKGEGTFKKKDTESYEVIKKYWSK